MRRSYTGWIALGLSSVLIIFAYMYFFGVTVGGDKMRYIGRGTHLLDTIFADGSFADFNLDHFDIFNLIPNVVIAVGFNLFGDGFRIISILLNGFLYLSVIGMIVYFVRHYFFDNLLISPLFTAASLIAFLGLPGELVKYIFNSFSSDIISVFISTLSLLLILLAQIHKQASLWVGALVVSLFAVLTRLSGVVLLAVWILAYVSSYVPVRSASRIVLITGAICCAASFVIWPWVIYEIVQSGKVVDSGFGWVIKQFQQGIVISGRENPRVENMEFYFDYVWLMILRFFYYFIPFREGYSYVHIVWNLSVVIVILTGFYNSFSWFKKQNSEILRIESILVISIVFFAVLYAAIQVEDWRYYLAVWPPIWILVTIGFSDLDINRY